MSQNDSFPATDATADAELERLARKRAGRKMGWYLHALVYLVVNLGLVILASSHGRHWAVYPLLGWGLGLTIHGALVFLAPRGGGLHRRLVARERAVLQRERSGERG